MREIGGPVGRDPGGAVSCILGVVELHRRFSPKVQLERPAVATWQQRPGPATARGVVLCSEVCEAPRHLMVHSPRLRRPRSSFARARSASVAAAGAARGRGGSSITGILAGWAERPPSAQSSSRIPQTASSSATSATDGSRHTGAKRSPQGGSFITGTILEGSRRRSTGAAGYGSASSTGPSTSFSRSLR